MFRTVLNLGILAVGYAIYLCLVMAPEKSTVPPAKPQPIRTQVTEVQVCDYPVIVKSQGIVQPHNEIVLSSQVGGEIVRISPAFEVGSYFKEGDVLVEIDPSDYSTALALAEAQLIGARAALQLATQNHEQNRNLMGRQAIALGELAVTSAAQAQAVADVSSATANLDQAKRNLERTKIRAPFAGRVRSKLVGLGQTVSANTPLGGIFAIEFAEVRLPIGAHESQFLTLPELPGDPPVSVELRDPLNRAADAVWQATIVRTEGVLDENSRELYAIARVDDPFGRKSNLPALRIGQPVVGSISGRVLPNVVALPRSTVRQLDQICLIDRDDLTLTTRTISPLWSDEKHVIVRDSGLTPGSLVSTTHMVYAPNGARVEIIPNVPPATREAKADPTTRPVSLSP
jgi:RND family efflux transporter MFP subunit